MPVKNIQRQNSDEGGPPDALGPGLHYKKIVHWLRLHLGGHRQVDVDLLKLQVQKLSERQWLKAAQPAERIRPPYNWRDSRQSHDDVSAIPDSQPIPSEVVYLQELLSILENNLMSDEIPYFRAIVERTPAKDLARQLGAHPNTVWRRMKQVRLKTQSIIKSLNGLVSS
jgi:hypothetical protein